MFLFFFLQVVVGSCAVDVTAKAAVPHISVSNLVHMLIQLKSSFVCCFCPLQHEDTNTGTLRHSHGGVGRNIAGEQNMLLYSGCAFMFLVTILMCVSTVDHCFFSRGTG